MDFSGAMLFLEKKKGKKEREQETSSEQMGRKQTAQNDGLARQLRSPKLSGYMAHR
jgi:hypothetical protein